MIKILIVDDDQDLRFNLSGILKEEGYEVIEAEDGRKALKIIQGNCPDLVLLDMRLPEMDGMQVLEKMKKYNRDLVVIMLTAYSEVNDAVKAIRLGAYDYISKPFHNDELLMTIKRACENINLRRELEKTLAQLDAQKESSKVMGESAAIRMVLKQIRLVAPTNMIVILQGESGVGKEVVANLIHKHSRRQDKPFVPVDCGTIPDQLTESILFGHEKGVFTGADEVREGQFECAHEGTIFLDEIVNTSEAVQMKMLRVVQEKKLRRLGGKKDIPVDVRIITASNVNLDDAVKAGKLRADLFHRLNEFVIKVPPLRERRDDIPVLSRQFMQEANREMQKNITGFSTSAMKLLLDAAWPGNVREMRNVVKRAVLLTENDTITPDKIAIGEVDRLLAPACQAEGMISAAHSDEPSPSMKSRVVNAQERIEREELVKALRFSGGNKAKAARALQINRITLYAKIKKYGLLPP